VSIVVDGDDPIRNTINGNGHSNDSDSDDGNENTKREEIIQVPVNGLLDRLTEYSKKGIVVDSRVYAFAIGLKKGEKLAQAQMLPDEAEQAN